MSGRGAAGVEGQGVGQEAGTDGRTEGEREKGRRRGSRRGGGGAGALLAAGAAPHAAEPATLTSPLGGHGADVPAAALLSPRRLSGSPQLGPGGHTGAAQPRGVAAQTCSLFALFLLVAVFLKGRGLAGGARGGIAHPASVPARCDARRPFVLPCLFPGFLLADLPHAQSTRALIGACGLRLSLGEGFSNMSGFHLHVFLP